MNQPAQMHGPPPSASPFAMDQMRREFEQLHTGPAQQRNGSPSHANWAGEFDSGGPPQLQQLRKSDGFDPREFERYRHMKQGGMNGDARTANGSMASGNTYQQPMGGMNSGYGPIWGNNMGMGMGMGMQRPFGTGGVTQQPQVAQDKGKGRMIELDDKDWEEQFAQLDAQPDEGQLSDEAQKAMEAELEDYDRFVHPAQKPDPFLDNPTQENISALGDFESVWQRILAETPELRNRTFSHTADSIDEFANFDANNLDLNTHISQNPNAGQYQFEPDNIFSEIMNPFEEGVRIMDEGGNLSLAALAFEAAVQRDPSHVAAWTRLGAAQAQNEKELAAIRALEQAIKLDPMNTNALMGLAVSYVNEGYERTAYRTLERWLSAKYPQVAPPNGLEDEAPGELAFTDAEQMHARVTEEFIRAAQLSPDPQSMDPDVQVGLGVLFYGQEDYDKAVDCFTSALQSNESGSLNSQQSINQRPLLWNRLGATLANSGSSEEAITAYEKALEFNPNFVRARYNLGVSCINIGCFHEAAQHLLGALDMHKMVEREGRQKAREIVEGSGAGLGDADAFERAVKHNESSNLYDTLRKVFNNMGRRDLAEKVGSGMDPNAFRGEFEF